MAFKSRKGLEAANGAFKVNLQGDAEARSINQIVNVKAFGAAGDGVTDDSTAIALASQHCVTNGGVLFFPRGSYHSPTFEVPDTVLQIHEDGRIIQPNNASLKLGHQRPSGNLKAGYAYFDLTEKAIFVYDGTEWVKFLQKKSDGKVAGDLVVEGDLIVEGNTVILSSLELEVADSKITLNKGYVGAPVLDAGILVERGDEPNAKLMYDELDDKWKIDNGDGNLVGVASEVEVEQVTEQLLESEKYLTYNFGYTPENFGSIGDGSSHPLSERYSSLSLAQAYYPFATSLSDEIDYCALQKAVNTANSIGKQVKLRNNSRYYMGSNTLALPIGIKILGNEKWRLNESSGRLIWNTEGTAITIRQNVNITGVHISNLNKGKGVGISYEPHATSTFGTSLKLSHCTVTDFFELVILNGYSNVIEYTNLTLAGFEGVNDSGTCIKLIGINHDTHITHSKLATWQGGATPKGVGVKSEGQGSIFISGCDFTGLNQGINASGSANVHLSNTYMELIRTFVITTSTYSGIFNILSNEIDAYFDPASTSSSTFVLANGGTIRIAHNNIKKRDGDIGLNRAITLQGGIAGAYIGANQLYCNDMIKVRVPASSLHLVQSDIQIELYEEVDLSKISSGSHIKHFSLPVDANAQYAIKNITTQLISTISGGTGDVGLVVHQGNSAYVSNLVSTTVANVNDPQQITGIVNTNVSLDLSGKFVRLTINPNGNTVGKFLVTVAINKFVFN